MTIELGYNGDDFVTQSITCLIRSDSHSFTYTIKGFYKYAESIRTKLIIYKALKEFDRLNDYSKSVERYRLFTVANHNFLKA